jgi:excinuclease ABC subunit C
LNETRGKLIVDMVEKADKVDYEKTDSVLEAIILEANLIKKFQPYYNTEAKDDKSFNYVVITKEDLPIVKIVRGRDLYSKLQATNYKVLNKFGPFPNSGALQEALKFIRKIFPFRDEKCRIGSGKPCFNFHIGLCPGTCVGKISKNEYAKTLKNIIGIFEGQKIQVLKNLEKEMKILAEKEKFEKAGEIRNKIFSLKHIRDVAFIKKEYDTDTKNQINEVGKKIKRIEAYDVAHLLGKEARGVMIVFENGDYNREYSRIFTIKQAKKGDDIGALEEIIKRRLAHKEWPLPDLVVVDGGENQLSVAQKLFSKEQKNIFVVSVVKNKSHKPRAILGENNLMIEHKDEILKANNEAHRFAIKNHRKALRSKFSKQTP